MLKRICPLVLGLTTFFTLPATAASTNITVNPLGLFVGSANVSADFAVGEALAIGPSFSYAQIKSDDLTASSWGIGGGLSYFFNGTVFEDSWIANPFVNFGKSTLDSDSVSGLTVGLLFNYGWFWPSGFNLYLGFGVQYLTADFEALGLGSISGIVPALNFSLGWAF
jgi:hypothetical protein